jgi:hypothetical protein
MLLAPAALRRRQGLRDQLAVWGDGAVLRRYVRIASLYDTVNVLPSKATPELRDVRIISMSPQAFALSGSERIDGAESVQSWLVTQKSWLSSPQAPSP